MAEKTDSRFWSNDWLVFANPKDRQSLAIMRNFKSGNAAIKAYNSKLKKGKAVAAHAVRIQTFEGTLHHLISLRDPVTLRWARDGKTEGAELARRIAKELRVKLPAKRKVSKPVAQAGLTE